MKLTFISDTHTQHSKLSLKGGDVLVCAGDIMGSGYDFSEVEDFAKWFGSQPYKHKILVAGNHDRLFDDQHMKEQLTRYSSLAGFQLRAEDCQKVLEDAGIIYLNDSGITIDGVKFWGSPVQPWFFNWAFNRERGEDIKQHWDLIPNDTDVLITHGPPKGFGDLVKMRGSSNRGKRVGCKDLLEAVRRSEPKIHVFGHIHEGYGMNPLGKTMFINASVVDEHYRQINDPIDVEL